MIDPILITGCARSGTSMTAGIIDNCGAFGGNLSGPTKYNKKGMFENNEVRQSVVKPYLKSIGADPLGQHPLPSKAAVYNDSQDKKFAEQWREKVCRIFTRQGVVLDRPWYYKGAKLCLHWDIWHAAYPDATWIIVRRDVEDIVRSCLRTAFMRAHSTRAGWLGWVAYHEQCFEDMFYGKLKIGEVWPQRMINGDFTQMQMIINNLGLDFDLNKVQSFVEPKLWGKGVSRHGKSN